MLDPNSISNRLALSLPDIARWVETRSMLLSGRSEIIGLKEDDEPSFVVRNPETKLISVAGRPDSDAIREAVARNQNEGTVLAQIEDEHYVAEAIPDWTPSLASLHLLSDEARLPDVPDGAVRLLTPSEIDSLDRLPPDLKSELTIVSRHSPIAVMIVDRVPVSFCYAASETETLWDISIDTLADYRKRGYAGLCVAYLINYMRARGKQPVWGAERSNEPSMRLAAKLGFVPVDKILVFSCQLMKGD